MRSFFSVSDWVSVRKALILGDKVLVVDDFTLLQHAIAVLAHEEIRAAGNSVPGHFFAAWSGRYTQ